MSIRKRGDRYQVRIRVGSGQRLERTLPAGATLADARALEVALGRARIDAAVGRRPKYLIDQAIDRWVDTSAKSLRSWAKDLRYRVEIIRTHTAGRPLDAIPDVADALKTAGIEAKVAPATINRLLAILRRVANLAERWGWTREPLGRRIELVPGERPREVYVSPAQVRALAKAAEPLTRDVILFAALTGLRRSEILRLTPADIRGNVVIVDSRSKSGRQRVVPMPMEAARIARKRLPFGIGVSLLHKRFNAARTAAGLPALRFHDLRHAFGTWLAETGADGPTIRDMMGHSSLTVTSRYLQSATESARRAVDRLPRLGSQPGPKKRKSDRPKAA
jgi:integrase